MTAQTQLYIDLIVILLSLISGVFVMKRLDTAGKIILLLLFIEFINEIVANIYAGKYHNNLPVYNTYSIVELIVMSLYFNYSIDFFARKKVGFYIALVGIVFAIVNYTLLQPIDTFNSYYLFFEGFAIITMALIAFYRLLMNNEDLKLYHYHHFWFTAIFLFFWSITFLTWGLYPIVKNREYQERIYFFIWVVNIITYGGIGVVFQLYPKRLLSHE